MRETAENALEDTNKFASTDNQPPFFTYLNLNLTSANFSMEVSPLFEIVYFDHNNQEQYSETPAFPNCDKITFSDVASNYQDFCMQLPVRNIHTFGSQ